MGSCRRKPRPTAGRCTRRTRCIEKQRHNYTRCRQSWSVPWDFCTYFSEKWQRPCLTTVSIFSVTPIADFSDILTLTWTFLIIPENVSILGSDDMTTCIIVVVRHSGKFQHELSSIGCSFFLLYVHSMPRARAKMISKSREWRGLKMSNPRSDAPYSDVATSCIASNELAPETRLCKDFSTRVRATGKKRESGGGIEFQFQRYRAVSSGEWLLTTNDVTSR